MKCPLCGGAELKHECRNIPYEYKGNKTTFYGVKGQYCDACGEIIFGKGEGDAYMAGMVEFNRQVNAREVDPAFIARVRKSLELDQLILLFKTLEKHPEWFEELRKQA